MFVCVLRLFISICLMLLKVFLMFLFCLICSNVLCCLMSVFVCCGLIVGCGLVLVCVVLNCIGWCVVVG